MQSQTYRESIEVLQSMAKPPHTPVSSGFMTLGKVKVTCPAYPAVTLQQLLLPVCRTHMESPDMSWQDCYCLHCEQALLYTIWPHLASITSSSFHPELFPPPMMSSSERLAVLEPGCVP